MCAAHVCRTFGGDFELKILRIRGFLAQFLDNGLEISGMSKQCAFNSKVLKVVIF